MVYVNELATILKTSMNKPLLLFCIILILACTSNRPKNGSINKNDSIITVLTYGYPTMYVFQEGKVARKYGFRHISVADCNVTDRLKDSVGKVNKIAFEKIEKLNGKDWLEKYKNDILTEFSRDSTIITKIENLNFIKDKDNELGKRNNGLDFFVDSVLGQDIYRVNILGYLDSTSELVSYFRVYYNYRLLDTISIDKKILHMFKQK